MKIVFISANSVSNSPIDTEEEMRVLKDLAGAQEERFELEPCPAARFDDVVAAFRRRRPEIVHFSTHGAPLGEILLKDAAGKPKRLTHEAFLDLFAAFPGKPRLVILNACNSLDYARDLAKTIDCVTGVEQALPDNGAIQFTRSFYGALIEGASVRDAHKSADLVLENDRTPQEKRPQLVCATGVDPASVTLFEGPARPQGNARTSQPRSSEQQQFERERERIGASADLLRVQKHCERDGSSWLVYEVEGLIGYERPLTGFYFYFESTVGSAGAPELDDRAKALDLNWVTDEAPPAGAAAGPDETMDLVMDRARKVRGTFRFREPLDPNEAPYSFGWKIRVLNSDAVTRWEFLHLYSEKKRCHIDGAPLDPPAEYFARAIWFPTKRLELALDLPTASPAPRVRCFDLKNKPAISADEMVTPEGVVRIFPDRASAWSKKNFAWRANVRRSQKCNLGKSEAMHLTFSTDYPPVGSCYSIDWELPASAEDEDFDRLVEESEGIRARLLEHRRSRIGKPLGDAAPDRLLNSFYRAISDDCGPKSASGDFEVAIMTYDRSCARLVMADGRMNGGAMTQSSWDFWLPFGMGLAGACFRMGDRVFGYIRPREEDPEREEYYLKIPNLPPHACLLALPIDHPDFSQPPDLGDTAPMPERCRQLIAVVTIGSTSLSARMKSLCKAKPSKDEYKQLKQLRQRCQKFCGDFTEALDASGAQP